MLLSELGALSQDVAGTRSRLAKVALLATALKAAGPREVPIAVSYLSGELPQGSIGVGWAALRSLPDAVEGPPTLELSEVDAAFARIAAATGAGSQATRRAELASLFGRATAGEQRFLLALLSGELRQGASGGVMTDAVAVAAKVPAAQVRRAQMLAGRLAVVAGPALEHGEEGLARFRMTLLQPLQPMLAQSAPDVVGAIAKITPASVEWKLDGARLQVHKRDREVRAYTRNLADVTERVPEVVEIVGGLVTDAAVFDGEVIALRGDGRPQPFQVTMSRFGSKLDVERLRAATPLSLFLFDCLHLDGADLLDSPASERFDALAARVPADHVVPRRIVETSSEAEEVLDAALARGHEGVMVKALDAPYEAGRRGAGWLKVKRAKTLDLVVLAAEWGHGRRKGWLSNLHLGARDDAGGFVMLGKTFKGMTDALLEWQTQRLLELETRREGIVVHVRPELVVEVAFDGLQASTRYPGGLALRFARIKGYRHDKAAADADTIEAVRALA